MKLEKTFMLACILALLASLAAIGCGDDDAAVTDGGTDSGSDTDTDTDTDSDADTYEITATVTVPAEFAAVPVNLAPVFYDSYPPPDGAMPVGWGDQVPAPAIDPATPYELSTQAYVFMLEDPLPAGTYYMAVVLFVEGGGSAMPVDGVDWVGSSDVAIEIPATGTVDVGDIELGLYESPGDAGVD